MINPFPPRPIQTTGRYLVLLPEGETSSGMSALADSTGVSRNDVPVFDKIGVAVIELDPDRLQSLNASVAGDAPVLAVEPEQIMYAIGGASSGIPISPETVNYLQGYQQGVANLVDSLSNGTMASEQQSRRPGQQLTTSVFTDGSVTWGLQATKVADSSFSGKGIKVAVLDTGLDLTHPDFANRSITSQSFIPGEQVQDRAGHGTHCIGTACGPLRPPSSAAPMRYGIAYDSEIYVGKVLSNQGSGGDQGILDAIEWAVGKGCHIISMSLGAPTFPGAVHRSIYETVAKRVLKQGTLIIAAAGNESLLLDSFGRPILDTQNQPLRKTPPSPVGSPANSPSIMAVAALDSELQVATYSNGSINPDGGQIDIAGPGGNTGLASTPQIYSTYSTDTVPQRDNLGNIIDPNPPSRYKAISGTSMATPHVTGIAALYAEATGKRGMDLWGVLMRDAQRLPLTSLDAGIGLVQAP